MPDISQTLKVVSSIAKMASIVESFLSGKSGLIGLIGLAEPAAALKGISADTLLAEIKDLDQAERAQLEEAFNAHLLLTNKTLEEKIEAAASIIQKVGKLVDEALALIPKAVMIVEDVKALVK